MALVNHQAVVIAQFFARGNVAQRQYEDTTVALNRFAIGHAGMVDPARRVATHSGIDHPVLVDMKIKRVVWVLRVMRMSCQRFGPTDDFTNILDDGFTGCDILHGKNALAMHSRAAYLNPA